MPREKLEDIPPDEADADDRTGQDYDSEFMNQLSHPEEPPEERTDVHEDDLP